MVVTPFDLGGVGETGRDMFGFGKKKDKQAASGPAPIGEAKLDLRQPGVEFGDLTTDEAVDQAVASGRLERIHLVSPDFGGMDMPMNTVVGPVGAAAAKASIDAEIARVITAGGSVSSSTKIGYDDGDSLVPRNVSFELGDAGNHTLHFW